MADNPEFLTELKWRTDLNGVILADVIYFTRRKNKLSGMYNNRQSVSVRTLATIRRSREGDGLFTGLFVEEGKFVVSRNAFDDLREFDTLDEAKLYVESIFALEYS